MLPEADLIEGAPYFLLGFFDDAVRIPEIKTYIYVGKNLLGSDTGAGAPALYFQDPGSYLSRGVFTSIPDVNEYEILEAGTEQLEWFFELSGLIGRLSEV